MVVKWSLFTEVKLRFIPTCSQSFLLFPPYFADVTKALVTGVMVADVATCWLCSYARFNIAKIMETPNFVAVSVTISLSLQSNLSHIEAKSTNRLQLSLWNTMKLLLAEGTTCITQNFVEKSAAFAVNVTPTGAAILFCELTIGQLRLVDRFTSLCTRMWRHCWLAERVR